MGCKSLWYPQTCSARITTAMASPTLEELTSMFNDAHRSAENCEMFLLFEEDKMDEKWEIQDIMPLIYESEQILERDRMFGNRDEEARLADLKYEVAVLEKRIKKKIHALPLYREYREHLETAIRLRNEIYSRVGIDNPMSCEPIF